MYLSNDIFHSSLFEWDWSFPNFVIASILFLKSLSSLLKRIPLLHSWFSMVCFFWICHQDAQHVAEISLFPCHCTTYTKVPLSLQILYLQRWCDSEEKEVLYYHQAMKINLSRLSYRAPLKFLPSTPKLLTDFPVHSHHNFKFCPPHHPWSDRNLILLNCWETLNWFHSYLILNRHLSYLLFHLDIYQVTAWTSPTRFILTLLLAMSVSQLKQWIQLK